MTVMTRLSNMTIKELLLITLGITFSTIVGGYLIYVIYKIIQLKEPVRMPKKNEPFKNI
jgi:hypothetical protein